jgi:hypothetical protein
MNKIIYIIIFLLIQLFSWSQDTIRLLNGLSISSKILEVNPLNIKYKIFVNMDGPINIENKNNIAFIKYSNGIIDSFQIVNPLTRSSMILFQFNHKVDKIGNQYYYPDFNNAEFNVPIGIRELLKISNHLAKEKNLKDLLKINRKVKWNNHRPIGFAIFGAAIIGIGGGICIGSLMEYENAYKTQAQVDETHKFGIIIGLSSLTVTLGSETMAIITNRKNKKRVAEMVRLYNSYLN